MGIGTAARRRKKQLLLAIARAVDETGACRSVTQEALAASCGCTVRQLRRLVNELAAEDTSPTGNVGAAVAAGRRICTCCRGRPGRTSRIPKCPLWSKTRANRTFDAAKQRLLKRAPGSLDNHGRTVQARFFKLAPVNNGRKCDQALVAIPPALESGVNLPRALPAQPFSSGSDCAGPRQGRRVFFPR